MTFIYYWPLGNIVCIDFNLHSTFIMVDLLVHFNFYFVDTHHSYLVY